MAKVNSCKGTKSVEQKRVFFKYKNFRTEPIPHESKDDILLYSVETIEENMMR